MRSENSLRAQDQFIWPPLIAGILLLWLVPLGTSLGLDETGNDWVIKHGFLESLERSRIWAGTSWISNALMVGARWVGGDHEAVLRLPSVAAGVATLPVLYLLGKRLVGASAAGYSCIVFVCLRDVVYAVSVMRPYAVAVFFATTSMLCLTRWLDTGRRVYGIGYVLAAAAMIHAHVLFASSLCLHALWVTLRRREAVGQTVAIRFVTLAWVAIVFLSIPALSVILALVSRPVSSLYAGQPELTELLFSFSPPLLIASLASGLLISCIAGHRVRIRQHAANSAVALLAVWILLIPTFLFLASELLLPGLFVERYLLGSAPGIALVAGWWIAGFPAERVRRTLIGSILIWAVLVFGVQERFARGLHDWRAASASVQSFLKESSVPVLVISGFTESRTVDAVRDPRYSEVLIAPVVRYPIPGDVIPLPLAMNAQVTEYLETIVEQRLSNEGLFVLIGIDSFATREYTSWLSGRLRSSGFTPRSLGVYGGIQVTVFECQV